MRKRRNYLGQFKIVKEARAVMPYFTPRDGHIDYRFWNGFHLDYYQTVLLASKKVKILGVKYIDWEHLEMKRDPKLNMVIVVCKRMNMYDLMGFQYDWSTKILYQFISTFHYSRESDTIH